MPVTCSYVSSITVRTWRACRRHAQREGVVRSDFFEQRNFALHNEAEVRLLTHSTVCRMRFLKAACYTHWDLFLHLAARQLCWSLRKVFVSGFSFLDF